MGRWDAIPWTAEEDDLLCQMRSDFPIETFASIARVLTATFGTQRTRDACIARWHRIETDDTAIVRKATIVAALRERAKQDRLYRPETPWEAQLPAPLSLPDTPSLPMLKAGHRLPQPIPQRVYKDTSEAVRKRRERAAKCPAPRPPEPQPKLVMRVPTLAELDLRASHGR